MGGGTGLRAFEFKAGIGTASRLLAMTEGTFCVGVLVQANLGRREQLHGVRRAGRKGDYRSSTGVSQRLSERRFNSRGYCGRCAPLPHQLKRVAKRAALGVARTGGISTNSSGDLFIAFSTATPDLVDGRQRWSTLENEEIDPLLAATVQATEEAIINALVAAETMRGIDDNTFYALPHERLHEVLRKYNRLAEKQH